MALTDVAATTAHSGLLFFSIVCGKKGFSGVEGGWDGPNPFEAWKFTFSDYMSILIDDMLVSTISMARVCFQ